MNGAGKVNTKESNWTLCLKILNSHVCLYTETPYQTRENKMRKS